MVELSEVSVDEVFSWAGEDVGAGADAVPRCWTEVKLEKNEQDDSTATSVWIRPFAKASKSGLLVKFELVLHATELPADLSFPIPEVLFRHQSTLPHCIQKPGELVELIGPSDAKFKVSLSTFQLSYFKTLQVLSGSAVELSSSPVREHVVRCIVRRSFPHAGHSALAVLPTIGTEEDAFKHSKHVLHSGCFTSFVKHMRPHRTNANAAVFSRTTFWPSVHFPAWAASQLMELIEKDKEQFQQLIHWPQISTFLNLGDLMYVILCIKGCPRGPPLLPVPVGAENLVTYTVDVVMDTVDGLPSHWFRVAHAEFNLPYYLRRFQAMTGIPFFEVYDTVNGGQMLVPYQAAVNRLQWDIAKASFNIYFNRQKTAYRRLNGGKGAPAVHEGVEAKVLPLLGDA